MLSPSDVVLIPSPVNRRPSRVILSEAKNLRSWLGTVRLNLATSALAALIFFLGSAPTLDAYSVLSHEAVVDAVWHDSIQRLLLERFPTATPEQLREARAYAYGGAIIQDMGYYPFGNTFFSDAAHYVRSGDFVEALLRESQDLDEYAFALGALAHYSADTLGHPMAVNLSVPILYPKLGRKYGKVVTYADDPRKHIMVEFGFDVVQVAAGVYAPTDYHDFIGFKVSKPLLERAFKETYGLDLGDVIHLEDLALGTYRFFAGKMIPHLTAAAWQLKRDEIEKLIPGITRRKYVYRFSRRDYEKEYGKQYRGRRVKGEIEGYEHRFVEAAHTPGLGAKILAVVFTIIPRIGPLRTLDFKPATPQTERLFLASLKATRANYQHLLGEASTGNLNVPNQDLDTGKPTRAGEYQLADRTYANLLARLRKQHYQNLAPELRSNILAFYEHFDATRPAKHCKVCRNIPQELEAIKSASGVAANAGPDTR
jgi:hypothetical protein